MRWDARDGGGALVRTATGTQPSLPAGRPFLFAGDAGRVSLAQVLVAVVLVSAAIRCAPGRASDAAPAGGSAAPTAAAPGGPHVAALDETLRSGTRQYRVTTGARPR